LILICLFGPQLRGAPPINFEEHAKEKRKKKEQDCYTPLADVRSSLVGMLRLVWGGVDLIIKASSGFVRWPRLESTRLRLSAVSSDPIGLLALFLNSPAGVNIYE